MKIAKPTVAPVADTDIKADLGLFIQQPGPELRAVCQGCKQHSPAQCSPKCKEAPGALSIDPVLYPIERNVVPFVYELAATRLLETCWSCEGHMNENNELWKVPQISFYAASPVYVKLLSLYLDELQNTKSTTYHWHIVVTDFAQSNGLTYSVQPDLNLVKDPHLGLLQTDLKTIADGLHTKLKWHAQKMLNNIK